MDFDFRSLALDTAERLVDHDLGMRQGEAFALGTGRQEYRRHAGSGTDADRRDVRLDVLHGIVDGHACRDDAARAVDI